MTHHPKLGITAKETFDRHIETIGKLRHPNLISLQAYFQTKEKRLLVYDYQSNGILYSLIHCTRSTRAKPLHWTSCLKIAQDVVQGLAYIHQASRLVHGKLKSNVLLGADFEACITENCLAILSEPSEMDEEISHKALEARTSNRHLGMYP
ncbi:hypothetical protein ZOSMA_66G00100 [Zostera marina]|uniref:Protein kinase domain-containing protein n=1 Tax=Zostera marina TaxID=29655 RepID=A0A0K9NUF7_ZOSMR|nr:hypothetical protein ZOSMA_66G00100 [Zostera marina]